MSCEVDPDRRLGSDSSSEGSESDDSCGSSGEEEEPFTAHTSQPNTNSEPPVLPHCTCIDMYSVQCTCIMCIHVQCTCIMCIQCAGIMCIHVQCAGIMCIHVQCAGIMCIHVQCAGIMCIHVQCRYNVYTCTDTEMPAYSLIPPTPDSSGHHGNKPLLVSRKTTAVATMATSAGGQRSEVARQISYLLSPSSPLVGENLKVSAPPREPHLTALSPPHRPLTTSPPSHHLTALSPPHRPLTTSPPSHHLTALSPPHRPLTTSPPSHWLRRCCWELWPLALCLLSSGNS